MSFIHRLSHHSLEKLHTCERLFQLDRLLKNTENEEKEHYPATVLGNAFEAGISSYIQFQDKERAIYETWLAYWPIKEDDKRTEQVAINMVICAFPIIDKLLDEWEIVSFNGKPAIQLSFKIVLNDGFYYVGYVDFILRHKITGRVMVFDCKTTALNLLDLSPIFQNSGQCIGYSVVLDAIVGKDIAEYDVGYFVGKLGSGNGFQPVIQPLLFTKNLHDRLDWFISLGMDVKHIIEMLELNVFPRRGGSCLQYNKPCKHFGTCHLHTFDILSTEIEEEEEYQFVFQFEELLDSHIQRIENLG